MRPARNSGKGTANNPLTFNDSDGLTVFLVIKEFYFYYSDTSVSKLSNTGAGIGWHEPEMIPLAPDRADGRCRKPENNRQILAACVDAASDHGRR